MCAEKIMEEEPESKIIVVDTLSGTVGQGILLMHAVDMKKQGKLVPSIKNIDLFLYNTIYQLLWKGM